MNGIYDDVMYLDIEGHYGSAVGMMIIDVPKMSRKTRERFIKALDGPEPLRTFFYDAQSSGDVINEPYLVDGTVTVMSQQLIDNNVIGSPELQRYIEGGGRH